VDPSPRKGFSIRAAFDAGAASPPAPPPPATPVDPRLAELEDALRAAYFAADPMNAWKDVATNVLGMVDEVIRLQVQSILEKSQKPTVATVDCDQATSTCAKNL
jgi:hypothetical protein